MAFGLDQPFQTQGPPNVVELQPPSSLGSKAIWPGMIWLEMMGGVVQQQLGSQQMLGKAGLDDYKV